MVSKRTGIRHPFLSRSKCSNVQISLTQSSQDLSRCLVLSLRQNSEVPWAIDVIQTDNFVMMTMRNRDTAPVAAGRLWGSNFNLNMLWTGNITWNSFTRPWLWYCRAHWTWGTLAEIFECNSANALALFAFVFLVAQITTSALKDLKSKNK
jgi:hypothetical protein